MKLIVGVVFENDIDDNRVLMITEQTVILATDYDVFIDDIIKSRNAIKARVFIERNIENQYLYCPEKIITFSNQRFL